MRKKKIEKLFASGTPVNPRHLLGSHDSEAEWTVRMLTGPVLDLGFLRHRKRFWLEDGRVVGCNVLREDSRWGFFTVKKGDSSTSIGYWDDRNGLSRRFHDEVRATNYANLVVGRFYVELFDETWFVGYFTLRRRGDRRRAR
jgi:hypothetical protein